MLEFNRTMWTTRCDIIAKAHKGTYDDRQRLDCQRLHQYLLLNPDELPIDSHHYLDRDNAFFEQSPLDNVLMWKRGVQTSSILLCETKLEFNTKIQD